MQCLALVLYKENPLNILYSLKILRAKMSNVHAILICEKESSFHALYKYIKSLLYVKELTIIKYGST